MLTVGPDPLRRSRTRATRLPGASQRDPGQESLRLRIERVTFYSRGRRRRPRSRKITFNAGPAALPLPALERARDELVDFAGSGMSVMEHSHRGKEDEGGHDEALALVRELLGGPSSHG